MMNPIMAGKTYLFPVFILSFFGFIEQSFQKVPKTEWSIYCKRCSRSTKL